MKIIAVLFALLAVVVFAQDEQISIRIVNATDTTVRVSVTDTLPPRLATLEAVAVGERGETRSVDAITMSTPFVFTFRNLVPATNYDFTASASEESVATQGYTTLLGSRGQDWPRIARDVGNDPLAFLRAVSASSEAIGGQFYVRQENVVWAGIEASRDTNDTRVDADQMERRSRRPRRSSR